jgi:hypothetical protein
MDETQDRTLRTQIAVRMDSSLYARVRELAQEDGREISSYIRRVLQLHVAKADRITARIRKAG